MFGSRQEPAPAIRPPRPYTFSLNAPAEITGLTAVGSVASRIGRREALQVPAVMRARNLIAGSLGTLPVRVHGPDRRIVTDVTYLVPQPDPDIPNSVVMAQTVEDLLFEGVAWWRVTKWGWHGYPVEARHVPVESVTIRSAGGATPSEMLISPDQMVPVDGQVLIDGVPVGDNEVIRFDSPNPPLLVHAARAIRTCLLLEQSAALYAKDPLPLGYFAPTEGADPVTDDEVEDLLDDWEAQRARRAWGYVPAALTAKTLQWSPEQLQLAAARQHAVLEIARAAGLDAEDLGVSVTSRTYANQEQRWQALINTTYGAYVSAIQDRLSMRDVLPRGYTAQVDFGGFLRGDALTRMQTYAAGKPLGVYTDERIAELENIPTPMPAQRAAAQPQPPVPPTPPTAPPADPTQKEPAMSSEPAYVNRYVFDAGDSVARISFADPAVTASFRVDPEKRTISGLAVPWGKVASNGFAKWTFPEGSLHWSSDSRVKLNLDHDRGQTLGRAVRLQQTSAGLDVTFRVARGAEGDRALALAEDGVYDGLSIEIDFDGEGDGWQPAPADESVRLARSASLRAVALTPMPAFDDARVTRVAASRSEGNGMPCSICGLHHAEGVACSSNPPAATPPAPAAAPDLAAFTAGVSQALTAAVTNAFERLPLPQHGTDAQRPVPAGRVQVVSEPPVYSFAGRGPSLVRDAWHARVEGNEDARGRLRKFGQQQQEILAMFARRPDLAFAAETTGANSAIIPPGYRPDLYVSQLLQGRPLVEAVSRGALTDATPFTIPKFTSATGAAANHVEGTNPSDGDLAFGSATVSPAGVSGKFTLTREIVDSSNPAIDAIAFGAMREAYAQNTEAKVYAELNGANGQGGTITAGFVPSGAQVSVSTGGSAAAGTFGGDKLIAAARAALALYPFRRFGAPNRMHLSQEGTSALATATGSDGRPLLPSVGAQNGYGVGNAVTQGWFLDGLAAIPTWSMSGNAAGDADLLIFNSADVWAWESPLLTFRFEEKVGPANIELALFGYFATRLIRPVGVAAVRHTVGA
jgi:HK97 family phage prohead protease